MNNSNLITIEWLSRPKDCFFQDGDNWCPGWAIAKVELPYARWKHTFYLVRDFSGIAYWRSGVKFRERNNNHSFFDRHPNLDWSKIERLPALLKLSQN